MDLAGVVLPSIRLHYTWVCSDVFNTIAIAVYYLAMLENAIDGNYIRMAIEAHITGGNFCLRKYHQRLA